MLGCFPIKCQKIENVHLKSLWKDEDIKICY